MALDPDLLDEYLLTAFPNPERNGCPDENVLKALAERQLAMSDPAMTHLASCSECYAEYRDYRLDLKESGAKSMSSASPVQSSEAKPVLTRKPSAIVQARPAVVRWAIAATLLVALGGGLFFIKEHRDLAPSALVATNSAASIDAKVDLFNALTTRGGGGDDGPTPLEEVALPSSIVHLTVTLPRLSERGPYEIVVAKDRAGKEVVAHGAGEAIEADGKVTVTVTLDLRKAAAGMYFLATVRGSDNGTYYYPLKVG